MGKGIGRLYGFGNDEININIKIIYVNKIAN